MKSFVPLGKGAPRHLLEQLHRRVALLLIAGLVALLLIPTPKPKLRLLQQLPVGRRTNLVARVLRASAARRGLLFGRRADRARRGRGRRDRSAGRGRARAPSHPPRHPRRGRLRAEPGGLRLEPGLRGAGRRGGGHDCGRGQGGRRDRDRGQARAARPRFPFAFAASAAAASAESASAASLPSSPPLPLRARA